LATNVCHNAPSCWIDRDTILCGCACVLWGISGAATLCLDKFQKNAKDDDTNSSTTPAPNASQEAVAEKAVAPVDPQDAPKPPANQQTPLAGKDRTAPKATMAVASEENVIQC
jgi:hypothetical protein